jgi:hypothetical protein
MPAYLNDLLTAAPNWLATASQFGVPRVLMSPYLYGAASSGGSVVMLGHSREAPAQCAWLWLAMDHCCR